MLGGYSHDWLEESVVEMLSGAYGMSANKTEGTSILGPQ
jgi:hypothetical protein